ncbi:MAG: hypothetical protein ACRDR6_02105 [Pseudonocardiaceae bacterium]
MRAYRFGIAVATVALFIALRGTAQTPAGSAALAPADPIVVQLVGTGAATLDSFILNQQLNFTSESGTGNVNGASLALSQGTIEGNIVDTFKRTLFEDNGGAGLTVYVAGFSPVSAQVNQSGDGTYSISYSLTSNGSSYFFAGKLTPSGMVAHYEQEGFGGNALSEEGGTVENFGSTSTSADFSTIPTTVTSDEIPGSPGSGRYQVQADRSVSLAWSPASGNVTGYDIYRLVFGVDHVPELIAHGTGTSFTDNSPQAVAHSGTVTGIFYTVYAVGPTEIESPQDVIILVNHIG